MNIHTALITGASSGIGHAFARRLAAGGTRLVLAARREDRLQELAQEIVQGGRLSPDEIQIIPTDLAQPDSLASLCSTINARGDIDLLINNAGFGLEGRFAETDLDGHLKMVHVHITASMALSHAVLPAMIARGRGWIVNVSSVAAFIPQPGHASYSSTKAGLVVFSEALQREVAPSGVKVQALCPGLTGTEFHRYMGKEGDDLPSWIWMSADRVVELSLRALSGNQVVVIPGMHNRLLVALLSVPFLKGFLLDRVAEVTRKNPR